MTHSLCSNITVIDGAIVNLFVIIPSQYENAKKRYHFRDNEYETTGINVSPRRHMTCVEFILHKCDKMGFISMKRSRLQGKFDRILILSIVDKFY